MIIRNYKKKYYMNDGAAIAMVLIFIVILSLWMASIATLVRSGSSSIETNRKENLARAKIINEVIPLALTRLTNGSTRYGIDSSPSCVDRLGTSYPFLIKDASGNTIDTAYVDCMQAPKSGKSQPIASFVLTGGNCAIIVSLDCQAFTSASKGIIGVHGGLKLDPSLDPFQVTGGIINVSGAWANVSQKTLSLSQLCSTPGVTYCPTETFPQIIQPSDPTRNCPATNYNLSGGSAIARCVCPISIDGNISGTSANTTITSLTTTNNLNAGMTLVKISGSGSFGGTTTIVSVDSASAITIKSTTLNTSGSITFVALLDSTQCQTGTDAPTFDSLNPLSNTTDLSNYLDSISGNLEDIASSNKAKIPPDCTTLGNLTSVSTSGGTFSAVQIKPGTIDSTNIADLNRLTSTCSGNGTPVANGGTGPAVQFLPGIYRFNFPAGAAPSSTNKFDVTSSGLTVIAGNPIKSSTGLWQCDPTKPGVQFQFQNASYFFVTRGYVSLCPLSSDSTQPLLAAPSRTSTTSNSGNIAPFYWLGDTASPIFGNQKGSGGSCGGINSTCVDFNGSVFVPAGHIDLDYNGTRATVINFNKGLIARALSITGTGSANSAGGILPPPPFNGDRVVQFRIRSDAKGDLGIVQIVIRDYFGRRLGAGYKILSWRTLW